MNSSTPKSIIAILGTCFLFSCGSPSAFHPEPSIPINKAEQPPPPPPEAPQSYTAVQNPPPGTKILSPQELEAIQAKTQEVRNKEKTETVDRWTKEMIESINTALSRLETAPSYTFYVGAPKNLWVHPEYRQPLANSLYTALNAAGWTSAKIEFIPGDFAKISLESPQQ